MGKVFTWEEVQKGMIPQLSAFTEVVSEIRAVFEDSPLIGGVICGSVNHGHHNVRSDIDLLALYNEVDKADMVALMLHLDEFAQDRFVPIDFIQLTPELASSSMQGISPSMVQHIKCSARNGGQIKVNPFEVVQLQELDNRREAINWTRQKVRMLDEGAVHRYNEVREAYFLQKLLEAPIHGTRKLLLVAGEFEDDSKQAVISLAEERFPELVEHLSQLVLLDKAYTEAVRAELEFPGAHDEEDYQEVLIGVREGIESVSRYMKSIGRLLEG